MLNQSINLQILFFLPAQRYASAGLCESNVSVCLSVTSRYCVKTKKAGVMIRFIHYLVVVAPRF